MLAWLSANLANIIIIAVLVLIVGLLIRRLILDKKAGKSSCGGSCASCGLCAGGSCKRVPASKGSVSPCGKRGV